MENLVRWSKISWISISILLCIIIILNIMGHGRITDILQILVWIIPLIFFINLKKSSINESPLHTPAILGIIGYILILFHTITLYIYWDILYINFSESEQILYTKYYNYYDLIIKITYIVLICITFIRISKFMPKGQLKNASYTIIIVTILTHLLNSFPLSLSVDIDTFMIILNVRFIACLTIQYAVYIWFFRAFEIKMKQ